MAQITLQGNPISTVGQLPAVNSKAPEFILTRTDLSDCTNSEFEGQTMVLNIFPSIDTSVCAASVRRFNAEASSRDKTGGLGRSADRPWAHQRFWEVHRDPPQTGGWLVAALSGHFQLRPPVARGGVWLG